MWRHHPWLLGLLLTPLLYGSVTSLGQIITAALCCASLLLLAGRLENPASGLHWGWIALLFTALLLPVIPLPAGLVGLFSPHRLGLAKAFPIAGETGPALLTLTLSPAATIARLWRLLLCATVFCLARAAAREEEGARTLTLYLAFALCLLASYEVWRRSTGETLLLGTWPIEPNRGAGTFANRNHFAGWIAAGSLFVLGWVLRAWFPLQSARGPRLVANLGGRGDSFFVVLCVTFGLAVAIHSGSRSGALAFAVGLVVWMALLTYRSKRRSRLMLIFFAVVGLLCLLLMTGDNLLNRLADAPADFLHRYPKLALWRQSLAIFAQFPLVGTGWGTFRSAFDHFKNFGGDLTFLHAENDFVQLVMETGILGVVACGALLLHFGRRALSLAVRERCAEPEAAFGALAALAAFAAQATLEFVAQITATALLASALAGFLIGSADPKPAPTVLPPPARRRVLFNLAWAFALGLPILLQSFALWHWSRGSQATAPETQVRHLSRSLEWWPCATFRQPAFARAESSLNQTLPESERPAAAETARARFNRLLRLDPFNAELRADRAWFDLKHSTNTTRTQFEIREACRLNPLNEATALIFAEHAVTNDPPFALELIRQAHRSEPNLPKFLALAWEANPNTASLWPLVPDTIGGLTALADFGLEKKLPYLAANAWLRLTNHLAPAVLAEKLLAANRADLALTLLPNLTTNRANRLLALRIYRADKKYELAIEKAEALWLAGEASKIFLAPYPASLTLETARVDWLAAQANPIAARRLAEKIFQQPLASRDLNLLFTLAGTFPNDLRLTWMLFSTQRDLGKLKDAATTAVDLATRAAPYD